MFWHTLTQPLRRLMKYPRMRLVVLADIPRLLELESDSFKQDAYSQSVFEYYINNPQGVIFRLLEYDDEIVSYILIETRESEDTTADLISIATKGKYRGQGHAKRLWEEAVEVLYAWNYGYMTLTVRPSNKLAFSWYNRLGFHSFRTIPGYYTDEDGIEMRKDLDIPKEGHDTQPREW